jgi:decaprenylphospho-beta-D-ribofuranose 2-oxidase
MPRASDGGAPVTRLTGWGRTSPSTALLVHPQGSEEIRAWTSRSPGRGVLARGLGRSYGDAAQNAGGVVLDMTGRSGIRDLDPVGGTVVVDAGVDLDTLLRELFPHGLTLPVQPGTRRVTVGGAIASDVHGKNHHVAGSFARHVEQLDLLTADGQVRVLGPAGPDEELFWATLGGMGLTGIVLQARLRLRHVESAYVRVHSERGSNLAEVMACLAAHDEDEYSVAWFDSISRGRTAGRGIVLTGADATRDQLTPRQRQAPYRLPSSRTRPVPAWNGPALLTTLTGRVFNEAWYHAAPRRPTTESVSAFSFFHPLDGLDRWNRLYGRPGLCQYQLVVPLEAASVIPQVLDEITSSGYVSCLNVLKRFGAGTDAPLSFPMPGWTLAVDLPVRPGLERLLDRLDALVLEAGGRLYLAKDSRLPARHLAQMYPRLDEFREVLDRVDPDRLFVSDLARRLGVRAGDPRRPARTP